MIATTLSNISSPTCPDFDGSLDPSTQVIVGGVSAGGKIALAISHLARDEKLSPPISGLWLAAPGLHHPKALIPDPYKDLYLSHSDPKCLNAPITNSKLTTIFADATKQDPDSPLATPMLWPSGHKDLPKRQFLQICGMDVVRDDAVVWSEVMKREGDVDA